MVHLINNPDSAGEISGSLDADKFSNSLMKRYYEYFQNRIQSGMEPLTNISADFTGDEVSKLYQLINRYSRVTSTPQAMREYINVILEENSKLSKDKLSSMTPQELNEYILKIKKNKQ